MITWAEKKKIYTMRKTFVENGFILFHLGLLRKPNSWKITM